MKETSFAPKVLGIKSNFAMIDGIAPFLKRKPKLTESRSLQRVSRAHINPSTDSRLNLIRDEIAFNKKRKAAIAQWAVIAQNLRKEKHPNGRAKYRRVVIDVQNNQIVSYPLDERGKFQGMKIVK